jgi:aerobic-type carbon monoxide dehydrogenase small subunit (CoxS/CutS family)
VRRWQAIFCRCTGYQFIVNAVEREASEMDQPVVADS